jgi:hypothetical protein
VIVGDGPRWTSMDHVVCVCTPRTHFEKFRTFFPKMCTPGKPPILAFFGVPGKTPIFGLFWGFWPGPEKWPFLVFLGGFGKGRDLNNLLRRYRLPTHIFGPWYMPHFFYVYV